MSHSIGYPYPPASWIPNKKATSSSTASVPASVSSSFKPGALTPKVSKELRDAARLIENTISRHWENKAHTTSVPWVRVATRLRGLADQADKHFSANGSVLYPVDLLADDGLGDFNDYISHDADGIHHTWIEKDGIKVLGKETIHIMEHGSTLCNMPGLPQDWPKGHTRVDIQDYKFGSCSACIEKLLHYRPGPNAKKPTP